MEIKKKGMKFWIIFSAIALVFLILIGTIGNSASQSKQANAEMEDDLKKKDTKVEELKTDLQTKDDKIAEIEEKLDEAEPWFAMSEKEQKREIEKEKKKEEKEKAAAEKKAAEEEEAKLAAEKEKKKKQEEKEKKGYETGITFDQIARTPDDYEGERVKFSGKVLQVMEADDGNVQLRIAENDDYDNVIYAEYDEDIVDSRILEDDQITIMGLSAGLLTYESTMGGDITIPAIVIDKIEQ